MKLNEDKTEFILFGKTKNLRECGDITLNFNDVNILQTDVVNDSGKSLGIRLDSDLSMERHINDVKKKVYWTLSNIRSFDHYLILS